VRKLVVAVLLVVSTAACSTGSPRSNGSPAPSTGASSTRGSAEPSARPTFTDLTEGDTESVVKLRAYYPDDRSAVVEPIIFMQGPDFCAAFDLPDEDPRCNRDWSTEDSSTKVTLPVSAGVKLLTMNGAVEECINWDTMLGSCAWSKTKLAQAAKNDSDLMVQLTTRDATITKIVEIYTP
jgi:hypothetical protein